MGGSELLKSDVGRNLVKSSKVAGAESSQKLLDHGNRGARGLKAQEGGGGGEA